MCVSKFKNKYSRCWPILFLVAGLHSSCYVDSRGEDRLPVSLSAVTFKADVLSYGSYPNSGVLDVQENPFRHWTDASAKWNVNQWVNEDASARAMVGFYLWASVLALDPSGENQYYLGLALEGLLTVQNLNAAELEVVRAELYSAYQQVLLQFPNSLTYSELGMPIHLATLAYQKLADLGGEIPEGWILIETENGPRAVESRKL